MPQARTAFEVRLHDAHVGLIQVAGGSAAFRMSESYVESTHRPVLGLAFEQDLRSTYRGSGRLPTWFSNLLPEGRLRALVARDYAVRDADRLALESTMIRELGEDLAGAVTVLPVEVHSTRGPEPEVEPIVAPGMDEDLGVIRFSLAGVGVKFSATEREGQFDRPAAGSKGNWLIKMPDPDYPELPLNEFAIMELARAVGIDVPLTRLIGQGQAAYIPEKYWCGESRALAVQRFDRIGSSGSMHIEDFAQIRELIPERKYTGTFESVAGLVYRGHDRRSLIEFCKRLAFNVVVGNGDAHLKNWSLRYEDGRRPVLSPAYDLVSVVAYGDRLTQDLGLRLHRSRNYRDVSLADFSRLERLLGCQGLDLAAVARDTVQAVIDSLPNSAIRDLSDGGAIGRVLEHAAVMSSQLS